MAEQTCELPESNPLDDEIRAVLENSKTIAVVGLSDNPQRESHKVAEYMKGQGYTIIPVNPAKTEILGEKSYPDLASIPVPVDIVDIFRNIDAVPGVVDEAIGIRAKVVWMQLGLAHNASARKAEEAGLAAVQSKCLKVEHQKLK
ncbi:MAG: CoA-binding protein [Acidobacteria bacterium]|nr:CoA-binding protein [Acidobacteriota bacterium]